MLKFQVSNLEYTDTVTVSFLLGDFLLALMFLRISFLVKSIFNYSQYTDIYSKRLCETYGFSANARFTLKCFVQNNPGVTAAGTFLTTILVFAYLLRLFERPYQNTVGLIQFDSYFTAIYCIVITITTVGYGDVTAATIFGRCILMISAIWGAFIISILIVAVGQLFIMTKK